MNNPHILPVSAKIEHLLHKKWQFLADTGKIYYLCSDFYKKLTDNEIYICN